MKTALKSLLIFVVFVLASCAVTPQARWAQGRDALTTSQNIILKAHSTGVLDDDDLQKIDPFVRTARVSLSEAETYLPDGGPSFTQWMNVFDRALAELEPYFAEENK